MGVLRAVRFLACVAVVLAGCGADGPGEPPPPPPAPVVSSLSASPAAVLPGTSVTITWSTANATSCSLAPGVGSVPCNGSTTVTPTQTTTYTLSATGEGGTVSETATVSLTAPTLSAINPAEALPGAAVDVTLNGGGFVSGATSVTVDGTGITVSNVAVASPSSLTARFTVATNAVAGARNVTVTTAGGSSAAVSFAVGVHPPPAIASFAATPASVLPGDSAELAWTTTNATSCTLDPGTIGVPCTGSRRVSPAQTTTYALTALGPGGSATGQATVSLVTPSVNSIAPGGAQQGETVSVTLGGTGFVAGATTVSVSGAGVTVSDVVAGAAAVTARFTVSFAAAPGPRDVVVSTAAGSAAPVTFTVTPLPAPSLQGIAPDSGSRGTTVSVTVTGTNIVPDSTTLNVSGDGVTVTNVQFPGGGTGGASNTATLTADLVIAADAAPGAREVRVTTPAGTSNALAFTVRTPAAGWQVAMGRDHSCALDGDGAAWCWGWGRGGRLGNGSTADQSRPVPVSGGHRFASIEGGEHHTCALKADGEAWCWGEGLDGRIGDGANTNRLVPSAVAGGHRFRQIAAGYVHTCGIDLAGDTWCWGSDWSGALGQGTVQGPSALTPVRITGAARPASLSTYSAASGSCALDGEGRTWCWGANPSGVGPSPMPVPGLVTDNPRLVTLATSSFWLCGLDAAGDAWCWGNSNASGQLGRGVVGGTGPFAPAPVVGGLRFGRITAGWLHACALTPQGAAWCWGDSRFGRLGNGPNEDPVPAPAPVAGQLQFTDISAGDYHTCGATVNGEVWCWGRGTNGRLGNGSTADSLVPVRVQFPAAGFR